MNKVQLIIAISNRAEEMGLISFGIVDFRMDIMNMDKIIGLRLEDFLNADDENFAHDVLGIYKNFNRGTLEIDNSFLPRFAKNEI